MHTAEGALTYQSLGNFFANPNSGVSSHTGIDDTPGVVGEYVRRNTKAWTASSANPWSVQAELCAFAAWDHAEWMRHSTMLENTAAWIAEEAAALGIPIISNAATAQNSASQGVCQHADLGSMGGGHWDCGPNFPIDYVLDLAVHGGVIPPEPEPEVKEMAAPATCCDSLGRDWIFYRGQSTSECWAVVLGHSDPFSLGGKVTDAITAVAGENGTIDVYAYAPEPKGDVWAIHSTGSPDGWNEGGGWYRLPG